MIAKVLLMFCMVCFISVSLGMPRRRSYSRLDDVIDTLNDIETRSRDLKDALQDEFDAMIEKRGCIALGSTGCAGNNGKCCRKGNAYTGEMRKCENKGSFSNPIYTCVE